MRDPAPSPGARSRNTASILYMYGAAHLGLEFGSVSHSGISVSRSLLSESVNREGQVQSASYRRFWQAGMLLKWSEICIFVFEWS